ncbi:hypothetical protein ACFOY2_15450 [Nonomuraea purpurea]|uniref:DUF2304 domain-containing protein n=1 Tax=Nonomuraea purpurea TaxID=1849276 RepID=A0ABV8G6I2_9ACTN
MFATSRLLACGVLAGPLFLLAWIAVCVVWARRFFRLGRRGWAWACVGASVLYAVIVAWPDLDSLSLRLVLGSAVQFVQFAALALLLIRTSEHSDVRLLSDRRRQLRRLP